MSLLRVGIAVHLQPQYVEVKNQIANENVSEGAISQEISPAALASTASTQFSSPLITNRNDTLLKKSWLAAQQAQQDAENKRQHASSIQTNAANDVATKAEEDAALKKAKYLQIVWQQEVALKKTLSKNTHDPVAQQKANTELSNAQQTLLLATAAVKEQQALHESGDAQRTLKALSIRGSIEQKNNAAGKAALAETQAKFAVLAREKIEQSQITEQKLSASTSAQQRLNEILVHYSGAEGTDQLDQAIWTQQQTTLEYKQAQADLSVKQAEINLSQAEAENKSATNQLNLTSYQDALTRAREQALNATSELKLRTDSRQQYLTTLAQGKQYQTELAQAQQALTQAQTVTKINATATASTRNAYHNLALAIRTVDLAKAKNDAYQSVVELVKAQQALAQAQYAYLKTNKQAGQCVPPSVNIADMERHIESLTELTQAKLNKIAELNKAMPQAAQADAAALNLEADQQYQKSLEAYNAAHANPTNKAVDQAAIDLDIAKELRSAREKILQREDAEDEVLLARYAHSHYSKKIGSTETQTWDVLPEDLGGMTRVEKKGNEYYGYYYVAAGRTMALQKVKINPVTARIWRAEDRLKQLITESNEGWQKYQTAVEDSKLIESADQKSTANNDSPSLTGEPQVGLSLVAETWKNVHTQLIQAQQDNKSKEITTPLQEKVDQLIAQAHVINSNLEQVKAKSEVDSATEKLNQAKAQHQKWLDAHPGTLEDLAPTLLQVEQAETQSETAKREEINAATRGAEAASKALISQLPIDQRNDPAVLHAVFQDPTNNFANARTLAQPYINKYMADNGMAPTKISSRDQLTNILCLAYGINPPQDSLTSDNAINSFLLKTKDFFVNIPEKIRNFITGLVDKVFSKGGLTPKISLLPIIYFTPDEGLKQDVLLKVQKNACDAIYIDQQKNVYQDLNHYRASNLLPADDVLMVMPRDGDCTVDAQGNVNLFIGDARTETGFETFRRVTHLDDVVMVAGVIGGLAITLGSGGVLVAVGYGLAYASLAYGLARGVENLVDLADHERSLKPWEDGEALRTEVGLLALALGGRALLAADKARKISQLAERAVTLQRSEQTLATLRAASARAQANAQRWGWPALAANTTDMGMTGFDLAQNWQDMSESQRSRARLQLVLEASSMIANPVARPLARASKTLAKGTWTGSRAVARGIGEHTDNLLARVPIRYIAALRLLAESVKPLAPLARAAGDHLEWVKNAPYSNSGLNTTVHNAFAKLTIWKSVIADSLMQIDFFSLSRAQRGIDTIVERQKAAEDEVRRFMRWRWFSEFAQLKKEFNTAIEQVISGEQKVERKILQWPRRLDKLVVDEMRTIEMHSKYTGDALSSRMEALLNLRGRIADARQDDVSITHHEDTHTLLKDLRQGKEILVTLGQKTDTNRVLLILNPTKPSDLVKPSFAPDQYDAPAHTDPAAHSEISGLQKLTDEIFITGLENNSFNPTKDYLSEFIRYWKVKWFSQSRNTFFLETQLPHQDSGLRYSTVLRRAINRRQVGLAIFNEQRAANLNDAAHNAANYEALHAAAEQVVVSIRRQKRSLDSEQDRFLEVKNLLNNPDAVTKIKALADSSEARLAITNFIRELRRASERSTKQAVAKMVKLWREAWLNAILAERKANQLHQQLEDQNVEVMPSIYETNTTNLSPAQIELLRQYAYAAESARIARRSVEGTQQLLFEEGGAFDTLLTTSPRVYYKLVNRNASLFASQRRQLRADDDFTLAQQSSLFTLQRNIPQAYKYAYGETGVSIHKVYLALRNLPKVAGVIHAVVMVATNRIEISHDDDELHKFNGSGENARIAGRQITFKTKDGLNTVTLSAIFVGWRVGEQSAPYVFGTAGKYTGGINNNFGVARIGIQGRWGLSWLSKKWSYTLSSGNISSSTRAANDMGHWENFSNRILGSAINLSISDSTSVGPLQFDSKLPGLRAPLLTVTRARGMDKVWLMSGMEVASTPLQGHSIVLNREYDWPDIYGDDNPHPEVIPPISTDSSSVLALTTPQSAHTQIRLSSAKVIALPADYHQPQPEVYVVQDGDSLWKIAAAHQTSLLSAQQRQAIPKWAHNATIQLALAALVRLNEEKYPSLKKNPGHLEKNWRLQVERIV